MYDDKSCHKFTIKKLVDTNTPQPIEIICNFVFGIVQIKDIGIYEVNEYP